MLQAAIAEAERIGQPMCISVVDTGGNLLAFGRMDGSKALSVISTRNKAVTAALSNEPTGGAHADVELQVTLAQENKWTNLIGGLPVRVNGFVLGAVAAGSGTGTQDLAVARAGARGDCRRRHVRGLRAARCRRHRHHPRLAPGEGA